LCPFVFKSEVKADASTDAAVLENVDDLLDAGNMQATKPGRSGTDVVGSSDFQPTGGRWWESTGAIVGFVFLGIIGMFVGYENVKLWAQPPPGSGSEGGLKDEEKAYLMPKDPTEVFKEAYNDA
jgi:hypothetical protein